MINSALIAYLNSNVSGVTFYVSQAPKNFSLPCGIIENDGDSRDRHWASTGVTTGLKTQEYELVVWADMVNGGPKLVAEKADAIITLLDNFSGPLLDSQSSPNVNHRIAGIEASDGGGGFEAGPELYGHSVFLTITYV